MNKIHVGLLLTVCLFFIEFCNHLPFGVPTEEKWNDCINTFVEYMKHPSYMRVDGKLVFKVHGGELFLYQCSGLWCTKGEKPEVAPEKIPELLAKAQHFLDLLRAAVRAAGLGEMVIGGGLVSTLEPLKESNPIAQLYEFTGTYMDVLDELPTSVTDYPYELMADKARTWRHAHFTDAIPYMPYLPAGYNSRPWRHDDFRPCFKLPTREEWVRELRRIKEDFRDLPGLGVPRSDGTTQNMFTIYAWNEYGEGGTVAPTEGDQYMKLEEIKKIFGK